MGSIIQFRPRGSPVPINERTAPWEHTEASAIADAIEVIRLAVGAMDTLIGCAGSKYMAENYQITKSNLMTQLQWLERIKERMPS